LAADAAFRKLERAYCISPRTVVFPLEFGDRRLGPPNRLGFFPLFLFPFRLGLGVICLIFNEKIIRPAAAVVQTLY
jgi:hypothetical protein